MILLYGENSTLGEGIMMPNRDLQYNLKANTERQNNSGVSLPIAESAQYLAEMLLELRNMAKAGGFKTLQGILELAYYEAFAAAHRTPIPEGEAEHLEQIGADARKAESV
jgi:hypothetical protein